LPCCCRGPDSAAWLALPCQRSWETLLGFASLLLAHYQEEEQVPEAQAQQSDY